MINKSFVWPDFRTDVPLFVIKQMFNRTPFLRSAKSIIERVAHLHIELIGPFPHCDDYRYYSRRLLTVSSVGQRPFQFKI